MKRILCWDWLSKQTLLSTGGGVCRRVSMKLTINRKMEKKIAFGIKIDKFQLSVVKMDYWKNFSLKFFTDFCKIFIGGAMKENVSSFYTLGVFKNSLRYVYGSKCLSSCKSDFRWFILWIPLHKFNQWKSTNKRTKGKKWTEDKDCGDREIGRWKGN